MRDAWRAYLELAFGMTEASRKQAKKVARSVLGKGEATASQLQSYAEDLLSTSRKNREGLTRLVRSEVERALGAVGLASADEVRELTERVRDLESRLRDSAAPASGSGGPAAGEAGADETVTQGTGVGETGAGSPAAGPTVTKPIPKKAVAKKTVAKKAVAKKATPAGAPPAKTPVTKKATPPPSTMEATG